MLDLGELLIKIKVDDKSAKQQLKVIEKSAEKSTSGIQGKFSDLGGKIGTALKGAAIGAAAALGAAVVKVGKDALLAYADFEQLSGGVQKLFGDEAAKTVEANAKKAFKTAGISANEYMEQVTSFSASLIQSLGGDTEKAAQVADMAVRDMSDNANVFGTDISLIQNAYQGFAKQNYTMLDNLKLGYGGTKTEMERLLADAEKISGIHYDISNLNDVYEAIHVIQEETNITGTTTKEASKTIEGSVNAMKASWTDLMTALGTGDDSEIQEALSNFMSSLGDVVKNVGPRLVTIGKSLVTTLFTSIRDAIQSGQAESLGQSLLTKITTMINSIGTKIPQLIGSLGAKIPQLISGFFNSYTGAFNNITGAVSNIFDNMINAIKGDGKFAEAGKNMISKLATGIQQAIPIIQAALPQAWDAVLNFLTTLAGKLRTFITEGMTKLGSLFATYFPVLIQKLASLAEKVPALLQTLVQKITTKIQGLFSGDGQSKLASAGMNMLKGLASGILKAIPVVIKAIPKIVVAIVKLLFTLVASLFKLGGTIIKSFGKGLLSAVGTALGPFGKKIAETFGKIKDKVTEKVKSLLTAVKTIFTNIRSAITDRVTSAKDKVILLFTKIKDGIKNKITSIPSTVKNIFSKVKDAITDKIESAKEKVKSIIEKIKGFFKFKVPKPHIPLPHFSITPAGWRVKDLLKGDIPHLGVSWYAKGGRFDEPALVPGLGEAGTEYALPLNRQSLAPLAQLLNELMLQDRRSAVNSDQIIVVNTTLEVDGRQIAKTTAPYMKNAIDRIDRADARQMGLV